jgi:hypothetical protein
MAEVKVVDVIRHLVPRLFVAYLACALAAVAAFAIAVAAYARPIAALYLLVGAIVGVSVRTLLKTASRHHALERAGAILAVFSPATEIMSRRTLGRF